MYCGYQDREELEDELYREEEEESEGSEVNSELEFQLYSQLHYSSNAGERENKEEEGEDEEPLEVIDDIGAGVAARKDSKQKRPSHGEGGLWQHLKGHTELKKKKDTREKQKEKVDPKGQRSSVFQEVIVIDSGTDVITVSDGDTDDGVCALKGQKSKPQPLQASTAAQQVTQKRKRSPSLDSVVVLDSDDYGSGSDSESEGSGSGSESESDSDGLENWMILGRGNQDGDQSISLNLEGQADGNAEDEAAAERRWLVSTKDREALICNRDTGSRLPVRRLPNRYYTDKNVTCRNCNKTGHLSKNCPSPQKEPCCYLCGTQGHQAVGCPSKHCNNCGLPGHLYESCSEKAYWHKKCHRCGMTGHFLDACPEIWRQYHITTEAGPPKGQEGEDKGRTPPYCYNCSRKGHFGHDCTQRRMFNGTYASTPYINYYDTKGDIGWRDNRIKRRVKELKEAGLFPSKSQAPLTPGPPRKKQKTNHHNNSSTHHHHPTPSHQHHAPSHHSCHTPHHNPNYNKPSHIRFPQTPKNKMATKQGNQSSSTKQWKPKRDVPTTRGSLPPKPFVNDADDFPRGEREEEKKKKKKKSKKNKNVLPGPPGAPFKPSAYTPDRLFGTGRAGANTPNRLFGTGQDGEMRSKNKKNNRQARQARRRDRQAARQAAADIYPTDENLFIIKQKKRKR